MSTITELNVIQVAIRIEENGKRCYLMLADKFKHSAEVSAFFESMAAQEGDHIVYFQELSQSLGDYQPDARELHYVRSLADNVVFTRTDLDAEMASIDSFSEALSFAMQRELDAVNYYNSLKRVVPESEFAVLESLIAEEQSHYSMLMKYFNRVNRPN